MSSKPVEETKTRQRLKDIHCGVVFRCFHPLPCTGTSSTFLPPQSTNDALQAAKDPFEAESLVCNWMFLDVLEYTITCSNYQSWHLGLVVLNMCTMHVFGAVYHACTAWTKACRQQPFAQTCTQPATHAHCYASRINNKVLHSTTVLSTSYHPVRVHMPVSEVFRFHHFPAAIDPWVDSMCSGRCFFFVS